ncbi:MAG: GNAT family N-acetyltransferase [Bacteroidales bacterium]|nr:GNAT family N-acetyltransferase [Bacteroidales bacterium]
MPFITPDDKRWLQTMEGRHCDIYHSPEYVRLEAMRMNAEPMAWFEVIGEHQFLIPLLGRTITGTGERDLISPYGYPGILYKEGTQAIFINEALQKFSDQASQEGYVSSFIRLHPLYNVFPLTGIQNSTRHTHGTTLSVNLMLTMAEIRKAYAQNHKRNIKRILREGYRVQVNSWDQLSSFMELYYQTMKRKQARKGYFFPEDYFTGLQKRMEENLILVMVFDEKNKPASGGLFTHVNGIAQFHLGGSSDTHIKWGPSKLMMDAAIEQCKLQGAYTLHLGGGYGSSTTDGLFRFKSGFGKQTHKFNTLRLIHHREVYSRLLEYNGVKDKSTGAFFPEYRFIEV